MDNIWLYGIECRVKVGIPAGEGQLQGDTESKHQAAKRWVSAVNNWGKLGRWDFLVCRDPQKLGTMISNLGVK